MNSIEQDFWAELAQIQGESIGWITLDEGAYLHVESDDAVIQVVGIAKAEMAGGRKPQTVLTSLIGTRSA